MNGSFSTSWEYAGKMHYARSNDQQTAQMVARSVSACQGVTAHVYCGSTELGRYVNGQMVPGHG